MTKAEFFKKKFFKRAVVFVAAMLSTGLSVNAFAEECDEANMDAFAYEDCLKAERAANGGSTKDDSVYSPFNREAYLTSSFGENRGTRYHAGLDYSTQMEEGWPIYAPEDGVVKELRVSPFGYGKVMFFQGKSGKTWVFAHQSSFGKLDDRVIKQQYASKKNDVVVKPNAPYKQGDTLTFSGSTGIGNPHLHVEVRLDEDRVINPTLMNIAVADTIAPQIFGAAVWQGNHLSITSAESIEKGCIETPVRNEFGLNVAIKIADYSREPKDNPMSVRRITLWRYDEKIYDEYMDTLRFSRMLDIRNQLLWAEEADTAGDWHFINAKVAPLSTYTLEVEDFAGNVRTDKFTFHTKCRLNQEFPLTKFQTSPVFTFLARPMVDLKRCDAGTRFTALGSGHVLAEDLCQIYKHKPLLIAKIAEKYPSMTEIRYADAGTDSSSANAEKSIQVFTYGKGSTNVTWKTNVEGIGVTQKLSGLYARDTSLRALAVTRTHTDSLDFLEFHPKGLQLNNWNVCVENAQNPAPLYWLGETSRNWFIFSKQTKGKSRCASANELRDIANIDNKEAPTLGFPYWADMMIGGVRQPALKVPMMFKYDGVADGNAITVKVGKKWVAAEYDSEPREIVIEGEKLPDAGSEATIEIKDEAGHKATYEISIPEM